MCLQLLLAILTIIWSYMRWINGCLGNFLAMVRQDMQDMLHCCQLCVEIKGEWCWRCRCIKGPGQKIILPIISNAYLDNLQWSSKLYLQFQCVMFNNKARIHLNYQCQHLQRSSIPTIPKLAKKGHDIVIFNGNVLGHALHTWCKKDTIGKKMSLLFTYKPYTHYSNQFTLEQWAF